MRRTIFSSYSSRMLWVVMSLLRWKTKRKKEILLSSRCPNGNFRRKSRLWKPSWLLKVPVTLLNRRMLNANEDKKP